MKPLLLDLFCGAGGAGKGYADAGFEVVGVDIDPQPDYPFEFRQADALVVLDLIHDANPNGYDAFRWLTGRGFHAVHASVPCQRWTPYRRKGHGVGDDYPDLIAEVRERLRESGLPYVIENVPAAPLKNPVQLCGSSFGLDVRRHRSFEASWPLLVPPCDHSWQTPRFPAATNRKPNSRRTVEVGVWRIPLDVQQRAMGIDWMTREELSQAVPPAFTEHIGHQLMQHVRASAPLIELEADG